MKQYILPFITTLTISSSSYATIIEKQSEPQIINDSPIEITQQLEEKIVPTQEEVDYKRSISTKDFTNKAKLTALNKITAKTSPLEINLKQAATFGTLEIILHSCWAAPKEQNPESKALIEVVEQIPGEEKKRIYLGWMFASTPAISGMEHPVYDITLIECNNATTPDKTGQASNNHQIKKPSQQTDPDNQ